MKIGKEKIPTMTMKMEVKGNEQEGAENLPPLEF
ncbi:hypothetical protein BMS3Abin06_01291 [bacterium BMS3Abin06]|nr:hypothetical protein BMS3Abin06_01291 [bacterium BMS3Abin06]